MGRKGSAIIFALIAIGVLIVAAGFWYVKDNSASSPVSKTSQAVSNNLNPATTTSPATPAFGSGVVTSTGPTSGSGGVATSVAPSSSLAIANPDVAAQTIVAINADKYFTLPDFPNAQFHIKRIYKATGGIGVSTVAPCGLASGGPRFIFMSYNQAGMSPPGLCFDADDTTVDDSPASLVVVSLEIINNGSSDVYGKFAKLLYQVATNGQQNMRVALENPPWGGYGATAFSSRNINLGFEVPSTVDQFSLIYGNYGNTDTNGDLSKSTDGFSVDFSSGTISLIPG